LLCMPCFACLALHAYGNGKGNGNTRPALRYFTKSVTLTVNHPNVSIAINFLRKVTVTYKRVLLQKTRWLAR
ncbi:MAG: hypothetical protein U9Q82_04950, partial [Chloroflexota bacterium]|nr:hypothetical protein [Chloroflexota bacterium]